MTERVLEAMRAAARGSAELERWVDAHQAEIDAALAAAAKQAFGEAIRAGNAGMALAAGRCATRFFLGLGDRHAALGMQIDIQSLLFMLASTVEEYEGVRDGCRQLLGLARQIAAEDLAARSELVAADACYFAAEAAHPRDRIVHLRASLEHLVGIMHGGVEHLRPAERDKLVSLLAGATSRARSQLWSDEHGLRALVRALAAAAERHIAPDFEYSLDPAQATKISLALAQLSLEHGAVAAADARLRALASRAEARGDQHAWLQASRMRLTLPDGAIAEAERVQLRDQMLVRGEAHRTSRRSRAGRLWNAQELDDLLGTARTEVVTAAAADAAAAFAAVEGCKSRSLLDQLQHLFAPFAEARSEAQSRAIEREVLLFARGEPSDVALSELRLASLLSIGGPGALVDDADRSRRAERLAAAEAAHAEAGAGFRGGAPVTPLARVQTALRPEELLVEYWIPYHASHPAMALWVLLVTRERVEVVEIPLEALGPGGMVGRLMRDGQAPVDASPLGDGVVHTRIAIRTGADDVARAGLRALHDVLVAPWLARVDPARSTRWIIVPHGMLHYVPFAALLDGAGVPLVERVAHTIAPSASVWHALQAPERPAVSSFFALANPYTGLTPLPGTEREVDAICGLLPGVACRVLKRREASEAAFRAEAAGKSLLHLATHGDFPEQDAMDFHRARLSRSGDQDGLLDAEEIRRLDLRAVRAAVLSICNGGLYRFGPGDEPYGLMPAFLAAGAENVVGSLWPIDDQVGAAFMTALYRDLVARGPAEAVRRTSRELRGQGAPIRDWAGIVCVGPGRPLA
jgi:hypothetical protein